MSEHDSSPDPYVATEVGEVRSAAAAAQSGPLAADFRPSGGPGEAAEPADPAAATVTDAAAGGGADASGGAARAGTALVGTRLAHFRIERLLGKGGMGEVYLATDVALDRPVALKFLPRKIAQDERLRERFYREARAQARINHPNVCHIYFIGEEDGQIFFAMEYIDGESLAERLERDGALPVGDAVEVCRMAALGLREANRHGFTHRDIKPSNLMIDRNGTVKVVDFGIVKDSGEGAVALTGEGAGTLIGTPLYMAPEQAKGERVDFCADIYSLGATLHHLVAGSPPFSGDTQLAVISKHLAEPRPKLSGRHDHRARRAGVALVDELCDRMMAKNPADRFDSYDALIAAIERASPARFRPAGFWVRAFALWLDVASISVAVGLAKVCWQFLLVAAAGKGSVTVATVPVHPLPLSLIAVYLVLAHARWGRTLGKRALEIEVVPDRAGGRLGLRRAAVRFAAEWGPFYGVTVLAWVGLQSGAGLMHLLVRIAWVATAVAPLVAGAVAAHGDPRKRTYWDRAAGTAVVYMQKPGGVRAGRG